MERKTSTSQTTKNNDWFKKVLVKVDLSKHARAEDLALRLASFN